MNVTQQKTPKGYLNVNRSLYFAVTDSTLSGSQVVNETMIRGLDEVERAGNITITKTGRHSFKVKGQVVLAAPKIDGSVYLYSQGDLVEHATYYAIANTDVAFEFESNVNYQWNQVTFESFTYNETAPYWPVTMNCSPKLASECTSINTYVASKVKLLGDDVRYLVQHLLTLTPVHA